MDAPKTLRGCQIPASDGSALNPPYNPSDTETFHENGEKRGCNQIHLNALYQLLDGYCFDCILAPEGKTHERAALQEMLARPPETMKVISLMDRGFEGYDMPASLFLSGKKFVQRLKDVNLSTWNLPDDREFDTEIQTVLTTRRTREIMEERDLYAPLVPCRFHFPDENNPFSPMKLRILRMEIAPGVFEASLRTSAPRNFPFRKSREFIICAGMRKPLSAI